MRTATWPFVLLIVVLSACATEQPSTPRIQVVTNQLPPRIIDVSDDVLRKALIASSIDSYRLPKNANYPCPYSVNALNVPCKTTSAYCREGGEVPLCYPSDITGDMLKQYRNGPSQLPPIPRPARKEGAC
jgi:hypothetical protein